MSEERTGLGPTDLDRVLEDLTAAPGTTDLRTRVLARIGSGEPARPRGARWAAALPVAAAIAAVTMTMTTGWLDRRSPGSRTRPQREPQVAVAPRAQPAPSARRSEAPRAALAAPVMSSAPRSVRRARPGSARAADATLSTGANTTLIDPPLLPALALPPPVRTAEIAVPPMGEPAAIEVPRLRVEPLSSPSLNGSGLP